MYQQQHAGSELSRSRVFGVLKILILKKMCGWLAHGVFFYSKKNIHKVYTLKSVSQDVNKTNLPPCIFLARGDFNQPTFIHTGPLQFPSDQSKSAAGTPQGQKDSELGREGRKIRVGDETSCGEAQRSGQSGDPRVDLQGSELWNRFYEIGTEMIITKAGR